MEVPVNRFKRALCEGRPQIGLWSVLANASVTELLGTSGYDWLLIDMEHAPNELPAVQAQLQALRGTVTTPIVRPPWNDMVWVKRVLDLGAQTLLIPMIETAEQATALVKASRYPPAGIRGIASMTRAFRSSLLQYRSPVHFLLPSGRNSRSSVSGESMVSYRFSML